MADDPALTVIAPSWRDAPQLQNLLASLAGQTLDRGRFEVIVVDDGNAVPLALDDAPLPVKLVRQRHAGPAAARNMALRHARGATLLFVNADGVLAPDALERHLAHHVDGAPERAVMGRFDWLPRHRTPFIELAERAGVLFPYHLAAPNADNHWSFFWTGNLSAPTARVRAVSGFDDTFPRALWEDVELGFRLKRAGLPLWFDPAIACGHDHAMSVDQWVQHARWFGHEWVRFARKHGGAAFPILGGPDEPTASFAFECLAATLHQYDPHRERIGALRRRCEALAAEVDAKPEARAELIDAAAPELTELLVGVNTLARMEGIAGAIYGYTPDDLVARRGALRGPAVIHTLISDADLTVLPRVLDILPRDAELILASYMFVPDGRLPDDPRIKLVRVPRELPTEQRWVPVLSATEREAIVFLEDPPLPTPSAITALTRFLGVSPRVGAVGLAVHQGLPHASAQVVEKAPTHVLATTRTVLQGDPGGAGSFLTRLAARGYEQAALTLAGG